MTSHELAKKLLELDDLSVTFKSAPSEGDFVEDVKIVQLNDCDDILNPINSVYLIGTKELKCSTFDLVG